jgi:hypothetical protein
MMIEEQRNLKAIKKMNKRKKLGQLASHHAIFLKNGLTCDVVENICNIYLKHRLIKMGFQNGMNTMDHDLTTSFKYHLKLI